MDSSFQTRAPGLVDQAGADVLPGLPDGRGGPGGVGEDGHAPHVEYVHRFDEDGAAGRLDLGDAGVGVGHRDVGGPGRGLALHHDGSGPGHGQAVLLEHVVVPGLGTLIVGLPAEERWRRRWPRRPGRDWPGRPMTGFRARTRCGWASVGSLSYRIAPRGSPLAGWERFVSWSSLARLDPVCSGGPRTRDSRRWLPWDAGTMPVAGSRFPRV